MLKNRFFSLLLTFLFSFSLAHSQETQAPQPTLESPYNTMLVHLYYLQPDSYQPSIAAKVFTGIADSLVAQNLAIKLKQVLDGKGLFVQLNLLPQEADYQDSISHKHYYTPFHSELPEVYLEKVDDQWFYSEQTVIAIPKLHKDIYPFGTDFLLKHFPEKTGGEIFGIATWQWVGLIILFLVAWLVQFSLSRILRPIVRLIAKSQYSSPLEDKSMLWKVAKLGSFVILFMLVKVGLPILQLPVKVNEFLIKGLEITAVIFGIWLGTSIVNVVMKYASRYAASTDHRLDEQLIPILRKMLKIVVVIGGVIYILQLLEVNVTALIAGVSIGGLALALAAQDTVKNLIGSAMIFFDKPFQIGDWVVMGSTEGEVVEVGFRSTRLKTTDTSIISVPNNVIASAAVSNMGVRQMRLFRTTLGVTYDTPPVLLEKFIEGLRTIVEQHELTKKDNFLIYFNNFGDSALQIYFRAHIMVSTIAEEYRVREELSFSILRLAEALGVRFAYPTQTLFIEEMPGNASLAPKYEIDEEKLKDQLAQFLAKNKNAGLSE